MDTIKKLLPLLKLYPWMLPVILVLGVSTSLSEGIGLSLFIPLLDGLESIPQTKTPGSGLFQWIAQWHQLIPEQSRQQVLLGLIFLTVLLKALLSYGNAVYFSWYKSRIGHDLRSKIFSQLMRIRYDLLEHYEAGKLMNTLASETWRTCSAFAILVDLIINLCTIIILLSLLIFISWKLTLMVGIALGISFLGVRCVTQQARILGQIAVQKNQVLADCMWEGVSAMKEIRLYGCELAEEQSFNYASESVRTTFFRMDLLVESIKPITEVFAVLLLLGMLSLALFQGQLSLMTALTFMFILYRLHPRVKELDGQRLGLAALSGSVEDVLAILNLSQTESDTYGKTSFSGLREMISCDRVCFNYSTTAHNALSNVSLQIPQGKTTAIIGPSGAGKTTLLKLLGRLYEPSQGLLKVDGIPLNHLQRPDWVQRVAIVSQDGYIFNKTVAENIAYGWPDATEAHIIRAATLADAHAFISNLPQGYDTPIGGRGAHLSGGQQQRIRLARALVRDPEILILDEATNALDSISEENIQQALHQLSQNRTVIIIAHRLSTIEHADQIIVLDQGQMVEQGTMSELLTTSANVRGLFARLYQLQNRTSIKSSEFRDGTIPQLA